MLSSYLYWQFVDSPKKLWHIIKQAHIYIFNAFSIGYLFRTLFAPWKRDITSYANPGIGDYFQMWVNNFVSRFVGFIMRSFTIITGILIMLLASVVSLVLFFVWFIMPALIIYLIYKSIVFL